MRISSLDLTENQRTSTLVLYQLFKEDDFKLAMGDDTLIKSVY